MFSWPRECIQYDRKIAFVLVVLIIQARKTVDLLLSLLDSFYYHNIIFQLTEFTVQNEDVCKWEAKWGKVINYKSYFLSHTT